MAVKMDTHIHTSFSTDSETDMQEQILTSYKKGLEGICITDHMDYNFPESALEHPVDGIPFCFDLNDYFNSTTGWDDGTDWNCTGLEDEESQEAFDAVLKKNGIYWSDKKGCYVRKTK